MHTLICILGAYQYVDRKEKTLIKRVMLYHHFSQIVSLKYFKLLIVFIFTSINLYNCRANLDFVKITHSK